MRALRSLSFALAGVFAAVSAFAADYHVDALQGDDAADGLSPATAWRTLQRAERTPLVAGDRLLLIAGVKHRGSLRFEALSGRADAPIVIGSYPRLGADSQAKAMIDGRGTSAPLSLKNCEHVRVENLFLTADGGAAAGEMRCGLLVEADGDRVYSGITITGVHVRGVSYHDAGFVRPDTDVRTANGRLRYGWGIRFIVRDKATATMRDLTVRDCVIERVDHTGLKLTGPTDSLREIHVENVLISHAGGPGVQMSGVQGGRFTRLTVDRSGSTADSRNWGRGSGLWTWNSRDVVIERSRFTNANGPGDSAGVHIDFHCRDVIVQYNFSANNAGGFCEILGNNYNCAYRYNISVNDGHRVKGVGGAFQEGKIFWLSGYVGDRQKPRGPYNSYFYNNTVYVDASIEPRFTVAPSAEGVLVANNIFHLVRPGRRVASDQSKAEQGERPPLQRVFIGANLYLSADVWPAGLGFAETSPWVGDARFARPGGDRAEDYIPGAASLVRDRGVVVQPIPGDTVGLRRDLAVTEDILGRPIHGAPDLGAIELP